MICFRKLQIPLALFSPIDRIALTDAEIKALKKISLDEESAPIGTSFLAWRRRLLFLSVFFYAIDLALQIVTWVYYYDSLDDDDFDDGYVDDDDNLPFDPNKIIDTYHSENEITVKGLGVAALSSETLAFVCPLIVVFMGAFFWTDYIKSRRVLFPGMLLQLFLVMWPAMVPLDLLYDNLNEEERSFRAVLSSLSILPVYLSVVGGINQGFTKLFLFAPSALTGIMVLLGRVFGLFMPFAIISLFVQILGGHWLTAVFGFQILGQVIVLIGSKYFITSDSDVNFKRCGRFLSASLVCRILSLGCAIYWFVELIIEDYHGSFYISSLVLAYPIEIAGKIIQFPAGLAFSLVMYTDVAIEVTRTSDDRVKQLLFEIHGSERATNKSVENKDRDGFGGNSVQSTIDDDHDDDLTISTRPIDRNHDDNGQDSDNGREDDRCKDNGFHDEEHGHEREKFRYPVSLFN